jgi:5-oxoprolinase (ATP-hydrolysing)
MDQRWQFWIDRGGTFTDIVARRPDGSLVVHKLLSENPDRYSDAAIQGIRDLLGLTATEVIPEATIGAIKMGTTVATNALLERRGDRTIFLTTKGFRDVLRIGYQNRPKIFAQQIVLPQMLYERVIEVEERYSAQGEELLAISAEEETRLLAELHHAYTDGIRACAIALLHGYRYPNHEQQVAALARQAGFPQISVSHQVSPLMKLVSRGDTTVADAYLSPILRRYVEQVTMALAGAGRSTTRLMFMQSNGGLTDAALFQGKDSILSGPAGGIVGAAQTSQQAGFSKIISFDMGGTSTDVAHYAGEYERSLETEVAGVRLRAPMMAIHTVAAGGGSLLTFDGARYRVGPASAGANPGPACYRRGGPLTVTDANVMLGRIQPDRFPQVFGTTGDLPLDRTVVQQKFVELAQQIQQTTGDARSPEQVATGFLAIAVDTMANAIKKISVQRGYNVADYTLCCFGGAGGQHACAIANALGMGQILLHPYAGVLSAYGMGLADQRILREQAIEASFTSEVLPDLEYGLANLVEASSQELIHQGVAKPQIQTLSRFHLRYHGTDTAIIVPAAPLQAAIAQFEQAHQQRYGFITPEKPLIVEAISVEAIGCSEAVTEPALPSLRTTPAIAIATVPVYFHSGWQETPVFQRHILQPGDRLSAPALIVESTGTNLLEPGWMAEMNAYGHLIFKKIPAEAAPSHSTIDHRTIEQPTSAPSSKPDPVLLEIFNHLFMAIAEQMGVTLQNTSYSVNIKERLDFSCAIFDPQGNLVANAPHIPVHLGSMGESVQSLIRHQPTLQLGDVYVLNDPYHGGTHLPDITVITPVFITHDSPTPLFFVASRGHHADIGGITPGSMPPTSTDIHQEGILLHHVKLVDRGQFQEQHLRDLLTTGTYPARNPDQNLADLRAQVAANAKGAQELHRMVKQFGLETVVAYMQHVQDNAELAVRQVIETLQDGAFVYPMDNDCQIQVKVTVDRSSRSATIDFAGTSLQQPSNLNAPLAVTKAAVLYVFRTLVDDDIPLNAGCLKPLQLVVPEGCLLNPRYPGAIVAGNVETSQAVTNALYGALGVLAASQGTMNNFTFGNAQYQYYETICGGSGAGAQFPGTDAVQTHMTNSRLTDPEVLEWRFPVLLEEFAIRPSSGGQGTYCGGNGVVRRVKFRDDMAAAILSSHRVVPPFGLAGGEPGAVGRNWLVRSTGVVEPLDGNASVNVQPGDTIVIETPGGGGYGSTNKLT